MKFKIQNSKFKNSFTLIELLVVISVIGIIAGISWGSVRALQPSLRLGSIVRDLSTDLRSAQRLAVTEQVNHGVRFSTSTCQYQIIRYGTTKKNIFKKSLPKGISFHQITGLTNDEVIFNPYGAVKETGTISLINTKGETKTIEVRPSGFVKIK
ncbi:prepilin-type N-terminal cleavage/methylation domain-containing protein [Patescibacteria group bacterium]|nr:prepilin-type N-terminal cleavage/methylation domain-containing protein [Patescibacteria group bacterium]